MATQTLNTRIALKSDTTANWAKSTLVLLKGEQAIEITESGAYKIKIGDGVKTFAELPYATMTPEEISALIGDGSVQNVTLASGTNNGTLKLTVDGTTTDNIAVKGLGSAAYTNTSAYATAAQGALATNAVRKVVSGTANGTISVTTGTGAATDIAVKGLGSAAYKGAGASQGQVPVNGAALGTTANVPVVTNISGQLVPHASGALGSAAFKGAETFATAAQGAKADKSVQSVSITSGTNNGTIKLTVNGNATDNIAVKGLGSAAYTASGAYATSAQGAKADAAMPKAGGTFTGTVTLAADPTDALQPTTKQYVDAKISSSIAASDAMVFKGTLGTNGTATALPTSSVVIGDTYKVITQVSVVADNSYTGAAVTAKVGDLVVAMSKDPKWIVVPSGDEIVTTVKYSTTTQNLTTSAKSGEITVGEAATKQVDSSIAAASTSTKLPTSKAVAAFVEGKGYKTTDQKVKNTLNTTAKAYVTGTTSATTGIGEQVFDTGVYLDTTAGKLVATTFAGALQGNATTATSAAALTSNAGSSTQPVYFSGGKPVACSYTLGKSVPADALFTDHTYGNMKGATSSSAGSAGLVPAPNIGEQLKFLRADGAWVIPTNTTYSVGTSSYLGITKLYTETGSATDGTMTQNAITSALNGKSPTSHTHNYAGSSSSGGAATSAIKLSTPRKIGNASFDGTADITLSQMGLNVPVEITKANYLAKKKAGTLNANTYYNVIDEYDSANVINDSSVTTNSTFSSTKSEKTYAKKSTLVNTTLTASKWTGSSAPYTYVLPVSGATTSNIVEINYASNASSQAIEAYQNAMLADGGQTTNQITIKATEKPTVDIPITIVIRNDL